MVSRNHLLSSVFSISVLAFSSVSFAASAEEVLKGAWQDPAVKASEQAIEVVGEGQGFNPIKKSQMRVSRGEIADGDLEYALRAYPKGITEFSKSKQFQKSLERSEKAIAKSALSNSLASRYLLLARTALLKTKMELVKELKDLSQRSGKAASYTAQRDRAELKGYLKAKTETDRLDLKIAEIQRDYESLKDDYKSRGLPDPLSIEISDLLQPEEIRTQIDESNLTETLTGQIARLEAETADASFNFERAKNEAWFDHFEISLKNRGERERILGLRVALNIPYISAPDMGDIQKAAKEARAKAEQVQVARESGTLYRHSLAELKTLLELHGRLTKERTRLSPAQMKKTSRAVGSRDPLLALEFQRGWYESYEQVLDVEFRIRELFISYLVESSKIANEPSINYLSRSKKRIL